ncbi:TauD/TfdA family dioxygenase [Aestuariispira insulae]|uniref:Gamma-butyrobetaine dioxygenase n=1 Tax=Aestuariispira insulae TaxID=1461337 RepID=A0A3D9HWT6_9PROT|nr:TauD/TfdA family dioxygenase [Aestuariispira insulae]RED53973.1 gamma-butyrobetaine dioxygenase [Aestuariispira insulae]
MTNINAGTILSTVESDTRDLRVTWADGHVSRFHHIWLRDNCRCPSCLHVQTRERIHDTYGIDPNIRPEAVSITDEGHQLSLTWPDGHQTDLPGNWLRLRCYSEAAREERRVRPTLWGSEILKNLPEVQAGDALETDEGLQDFIQKIRDYGLAVVRNLDCTEGMVEKLAGRISYLRQTNYGVGFDVESKPDPNNVAYTAIELKAHTDLANWESPPGIQFLHCLDNSAEGGESVLVDGFAAAEMLRQRDPEAFRLLSEVELPFRFIDKHWDLRWHAPTISLSLQGDFREIRYHAALCAPFDLPHDLVEPVYAALRSFTQILRDPAHEIRLKMGPGDVIVFHNRRVLHGRSAFDPNSGRRKLQGCYVDCDDAWSRLRVLKGENTN